MCNITIVCLAVFFVRTVGLGLPRLRIRFTINENEKNKRVRRAFTVQYLVVIDATVESR